MGTDGGGGHQGGNNDSYYDDHVGRRSRNNYKSNNKGAIMDFFGTKKLNEEEKLIQDMLLDPENALKTLVEEQKSLKKQVVTLTDSSEAKEFEHAEDFDQTQQGYKSELKTYQDIIVTNENKIKDLESCKIVAELNYTKELKREKAIVEAKYEKLHYHDLHKHTEEMTKTVAAFTTTIAGVVKETILAVRGGQNETNK